MGCILVSPGLQSVMTDHRTVGSSSFVSLGLMDLHFARRVLGLLDEVDFLPRSPAIVKQRSTSERMMDRLDSPTVPGSGLPLQQVAMVRSVYVASTFVGPAGDSVAWGRTHMDSSALIDATAMLMVFGSAPCPSNF